MQYKESLSSEEKRALLLRRLQKLAHTTDVYYPISSFQEGILFATYMYEEQRYSYNLQRFLHLQGILDQEALEKSINEIVKRHMPLRTLFPLTKEGTFQQLVKPFQYQKMALTDLRSCSIEQREEQALQLVQQEGRYVFNLQDEFPFRTHLIQLGDDEYLFLCVIYHLVFDLSSHDIFFAELAHCYQAFVAGRDPQLPPLAASYMQFVEWQEQHLRQNAWSAQAAYWQQQLSGTLPVLALPVDHPHPSVFSGRGAFFTRLLAGVERDAIKSFAQQNGCTLFHFLLTAFVILLVRYTGQEDLLIGTPMTRRDRVEWKKLIGLFVNTVVLRVNAAGNPTFRQLLEQMREIVLDAYMHSDLPFAKVVEHIQPERSTMHSAFYQAMFTVENEVPPLELPRLTIDPFDMDQKTTFCDLYLIIQETSQGIQARLEYNTDVFELKTIQRISRHFERLLSCVMQNPDSPLSQLSFLTEDEALLQFIGAESLPITGNGKLDRKALPDPDNIASMRAHGSENPHLDLEKSIAAIWQDLLGNQMVGLHDNFFELGGHSVLLTRMRQQLYQQVHEDLSLVDLLRYTTVYTLAQHIEKRKEMKVMNKEEKSEPAVVLPLSRSQQTGLDIAVIGMDVRLPGAQTIEAFWQNLQDGVESIRWFSRAELKEAGVSVEELNDPYYVPAKGFLDGADLFDAAFFGITPREAELLDPQQRLLLECVWQALEYAGYNPENYAKRIGLYAGASFNTYLFHNITLNQDYVRKVGLFQILTTNDKDFLATRVAYKLHLTGPAVTVQTACSTGLVAVHQACQSLLNRECEIALAGGSSVHSPLKDGYVYREGEISSPDGRCRAFDAGAKGTVAGDGVGVVVLKRLSDALQDGDTIYAVIKGSAINNDGALKAGYTAPSVDGQAQVIRNALSVAGVHPDTISYIEAHGTGTPLGDPIEVEGLIEAFRASGSQQEGFCALGSVKTNFGHLDAAAGIVGLIKVVLSVKHRQLFPSLHFEQANPIINFAHSPFFVNTTLTPWHSQTGPRRAGVSSFGIGGTNAHAIVEEAPVQSPSGPSKQWQLLLLSARSSSALATLTDDLQGYLQQHSDVNLADVAYTLQVGRKAFPYRRMLVCQSIEEALQGLAGIEQPAPSGGKALEQRSIVFLFPGQGSQYVGMASDLYTDEPIFREQADACLRILKEREGLDLRPILFPPNGSEVHATKQLNETAITQPALFVIEYALAQLWLSWGVQPQAMLGHSIGEYVAACLAGVFSLEDALSIVAKRGRLIQSCARGSMLSISLSESRALSLLHAHEHLSLAAINGPTSVVVAGPDEEIQVLKASLDAQEVNNRLLHTSHAFHSVMMEGILAAFEAKVRTLSLKRPRLPFISNVTGTWITAEEATDPYYWVKHVRSTVRFADGLQQLLLEDKNLFLEVGPGQTLSTLVKQHPAKGVHTIALSSLSHPQTRQHDRRTLLQAAGSLWLAGVSLDWQRFSVDEKRRRIALPTYPFERQRYWIEIPQTQREMSEQRSSLKLDTILPEQPESDESASTIVEAANELEVLVASIWQEILGVHPLSVTTDFFELGGDSLIASRVINELRKNLDLPLTLGSFFDAPTVRDFARYLEMLMTEQLASLE